MANGAWIRVIDRTFRTPAAGVEPSIMSLQNYVNSKPPFLLPLPVAPELNGVLQSLQPILTAG